jgi:hypothetical protein
MPGKNSCQIEENLWIADGYYIDFDEAGQFRIIGPNNHLYCGLVDIPPHKIHIKEVKNINQHLKITGNFISDKINLYYPIMDDIRTLRKLSQEAGNFLQLRYNFLSRAYPRTIKKSSDKDYNKITFKRTYGENYYQTEFFFPKKIKIKKITSPLLGFELKSKGKAMPFIIQARTNEINYKNFRKFFLYPSEDFYYKVFGKYKKDTKKFIGRTEKEIKHLISWGKTSGDRFGTVFPRDWMESAVLGIHDLRPEVINYMYEKSLEHISRKGEGWHEELVGEYKYEHEISGKDIFDRKMIDIEPNYIIGLNYVPEAFLAKKENNEKIRRVVKYLLKEAGKDFITFKKIPKEFRKIKEKYYLVGNWRDSDWAFKKIDPVIAPFDVNCVFYPAALLTIQNFQKKLGLEKESKKIEELIKKWKYKKEKYRFINQDGRIAYSLALYNIKGINSFKKMEVNHLDEAYLYAYLEGTQEEIKSFCERLLSKEYFYTPSGPTITAKNNKYGYTTQEYHGLVIWTKQTAFCVLGLSRHLKIALSENWPKELQSLIKKTLLKICEDTIKTFAKLDAIPEVHFDNKGEPKFFNIQPEAYYRMSKVQLWSAVGARRIIRKCYELKTDPTYKNI